MERRGHWIEERDPALMSSLFVSIHFTDHNRSCAVYRGTVFFAFGCNLKGGRARQGESS